LNKELFLPIFRGFSAFVDLSAPSSEQKARDSEHCARTRVRGCERPAPCSTLRARCSEGGALNCDLDAVPDFSEPGTRSVEPWTRRSEQKARNLEQVGGNRQLGCREGAGDAFADHVWLHATFVRIHPFADGNGRMARLLANVPLVAGGHPVVDIPATARDRYLAALARWQFACGAPRPNAPLFTKEGELKDFIALCRESQGKAAAVKTVRKKKCKK